MSNPFCYEADIVAVGVVEVMGEIPSERREAIAAVNGLSVLYGACREMLINITARSIFGPVTIPTLNFQKALEEAKQNLPTDQKPPEPVTTPEAVKA